LPKREKLKINVPLLVIYRIIKKKQVDVAPYRVVVPAKMKIDSASKRTWV
jgi:hypothetical protein